MNRLNSPFGLVAGLLLATGIATFAEPSSAKEELPDTFFSQSQRRPDDISKIGDEIPLIPAIGAAEPLILVDYFYSYSCEPCAKASKEVLSLVGEGLPVRISFHPVSKTPSDYQMGVVEHALYDADPETFIRFHFGMMVSKNEGSSLSWKSYLADIQQLSRQDVEIQSNLARLSEFTDMVDLNIDFLNATGAEGLPLFIIDGAVKLEDFDANNFASLIRKSLAEKADAPAE